MICGALQQGVKMVFGHYFIFVIKFRISVDGVSTRRRSANKRRETNPTLQYWTQLVAWLSDQNLLLL